MTLRILLSNDDGVRAPGMWALHEALLPHAEILVVAPEREQSGSGHALTLRDPLRMRKERDGVYAVDGTPTDCVLMGVRAIAEREGFRPDFVLSGINHGPNLGDDVTYSGTVAAAFEGHLLGFPSIAFSNVNAAEGFDKAAQAAVQLVRQLAEHNVPKDLLLNVNFPDTETFLGFRPCSLGHRRYEDVVQERTDPRGHQYFWLGGQPTWDDWDGSDMAALTAGYISVTPMHLALTDSPKLQALEDWKLKLPE